MRKNRSIFKPRAHGGSYRVQDAKTDEATVYVYDEISWWGIQAEQFVKDLNAIEASTIHLRFNSPGGSVFDGTSIFNAIKQHKSKTIAHVDGLAASIASVIVMAADEVRMAENAFLMIHEPWSIVIGTSETMREEADLLDKVGGVIAKAYSDRSGKTAEEIDAYMAAETWFTGQEAVDAGFADMIEEIDDDKKAKAKVGFFDLAAFANVPDSLMAEKGPPTEREMEKVLRDAGFSTKQSKEFVANGYPSALRDVETDLDADSSDGDDQRDVDPSALRDVELTPEPRKDPVLDLLVRAEQVAPTTT